MFLSPTEETEVLKKVEPVKKKQVVVMMESPIEFWSIAHL